MDWYMDMDWSAAAAACKATASDIDQWHQDEELWSLMAAFSTGSV